MTQQHYILHEVARAVGRKPYQIAYMISNGELDEPKLRIGNRRIFTHEEVVRIKEIMRARDQADLKKSDEAKKGGRL
ncbi:MAG TPA: MerR family transcriptional regulator [Gemmataceae bacterium]|jgi:DNA-binding transcriptional MerR regulator